MNKETTQSRRITYIDVAKGVGILMVLMAHFLPTDSFIRDVLSTITMPMYFIVSGIVSREYPIKTFFEKRFRQILVPYFLWAMIFGSFSYKNLALVLWGTNESLLIAGCDGMLWFLSAMFMASFMFQLILRCMKHIEKTRLGFAVSIFACLLIATLLRQIKLKNNFLSKYGMPLGVDVAFLAVAFIIFGYMLAPLMDALFKKLGSTICLMVVGIAATSVAVLEQLNEIMGEYPRMATLDVGNIILFFLISIVAVMGYLCISKVLADVPIFGKIMIWLGKNSMLMFILHRIFLYDFIDFYQAAGNWYSFFGLYILMVLLTAMLSVIIDRAVPALAGKTKEGKIF